MLFKKIISCFSLLVYAVVDIPHTAYARVLLPPPGERLVLSPVLQPPVLKGLRVYPDDPLRLDFILDPGTVAEPALPADKFGQESGKLIRYFLAGLTIPEQDLWVNLSPYEKDRIIPEAFGQTELGRDLLAQDYVLKQITSSLLYPEDETGKAFWQRVYALAQEKYGTTDIPVDTFNKVWIVPDKAEVYENIQAGALYITDSRLKVMLDTDYRAAQINTGEDGLSGDSAGNLARDVLREVVIPVLEKEVNEGEHFVLLRQVYQSLILAAWYKRKVRQSLLSSVYVNRKKISGVNIDDPAEAEEIWQRYTESFRKGVYTLLREEISLLDGELVPRKYFSGGANFSGLDPVFVNDAAALPEVKVMVVQSLFQPLRGALSAGVRRMLLPLVLTGSMTCTGCAGLLYTPQENLALPADISIGGDHFSDFPGDIIKDIQARISSDDWKSSLDFSLQKRGLVRKVRDFLLQRGVFSSLPEFKVFFLKGMRKVDRHDYLYYPGTNWFVFGQDGLDGLTEDQVFAHIAVGIAHELSHREDFERLDVGSLEQYKNNDKLTVLESEARAYRMTKAVMGLIEGLASLEGKSFYSYEALEMAGNLVKAFELLTTGPTRLPDLQKFNYEQVSFADYNTVVRIGLKDIYTGEKSLAVISLVDNSVKIEENPDLSQSSGDMKGGIDMNLEKIHFDYENTQTIVFEFNPAMLSFMENVSGFSAFVLSVQPLDNLQSFFNR